MVFGGRPEQVLRYLLEEGAELLMSEELITELRQKMTQKFPDYLTKFDHIEASIREDVRMVGPHKLSSPVSRDPDDDKFLETAVTGQADYIVSGDKDLLDLGEYEGIKILKPAEFLAIFD
jgi:putative PIN family toxin of toxin-antitoxin system